MRRSSIASGVGLAALSLSSHACSAGDPQSWIEDYTKLKLAMSSSYANLEFAVRTDRIDLVTLDRRTMDRLRGTSSPRRARKVIESFVSAFDDPHFRTERRGAPPVDAVADGPPWRLDASLGTAEALAALGYRRRDLGFDLTVERSSGYEPLISENPFPAGVLDLDGRRFGLLRIAHFGEDGYPGVASALWEGFRSGRQGPCDRRCSREFGRLVSERLLADLADRVRRLDGRGIDALVVDVTGNGGGTDWAGSAAHVLTRVPLRDNPSAFVRHEHWSRQLEWAGQRLRSDLEAGPAPAIRALLERALERNESLLAASRTPCDWSVVWEQADLAPSCSPLVRRVAYADPADVAPVELEGLESASLLDPTRRLRFDRGVYGGPLIVVTDGRSASATEWFVSLLQSNGAATVVGSRTAGAGCGYTAGGISVFLEHTGLLVRMPDCVRYDGRGTNELAGIAPDVEIDWSKASGGAATRKLVEVLGRIELGVRD